MELTRCALKPIGGTVCCQYLSPYIQGPCKHSQEAFFPFVFTLGADLHADALCCLLQVVAVAPKKLAELFYDKLDWIKVCFLD